MFGSYRYLLAHMVLLSHFWRELALWPGPYAVFSFFLLSGFLMSQVLADTYESGTKGSLRFLANRALRIYPPYWCVIALSLATTAWIPQAARQTNIVMRWPDSGTSWLHNLFIFGLNGDTARLVPPAWSLDIELVFYVFMGVGLVRSRVFVSGWLAASLVFTAYAWASGVGFPDRYATLLGGSLPFALGAMIQQHRERLVQLASGPIHAGVAVALYAGNAAAAKVVYRDEFGIGFYLSLVLTAYVVVALIQVERRNVPSWAARLDRVLGDLSYPVFLCHFPIAAWMVHVGLAGDPGPRLFLVSAIGSSLFAWLVHVALERPVNGLRDRIRGRPRRSGEASPERLDSASRRR